MLAPRGRIDSEGREVLSYTTGESGATGWRRVHSEKGLRRFADPAPGVPRGGQRLPAEASRRVGSPALRTP